MHHDIEAGELEHVHCVASDRHCCMLQGIIEVLATDGDSKLGGDDFNRAVAHRALDRCRRQGHPVRWPPLTSLASLSWPPKCHCIPIELLMDSD